MHHGSIALADNKLYGALLVTVRSSFASLCGSDAAMR